MRTSTSALFLIMLVAFATASQDSLLELMDRSPEGRDILNAVYLQLHTAGPNLERGKIMEVLTTVKQHASADEAIQREKAKQASDECKADLTALRANINENEKHEFTINRHISANKHALTKNQQFIDRSTKESDSYDSLKNLLLANKKNWEDFVNGRLERLSSIVTLLRQAKTHLVNTDKVAAGQAFVEIKRETLTSLSEIRVEFTNINDHFDGLRPIIASLLQQSVSPAVVGKEEIRGKVIRLLRSVIQAIKKSSDLLEQQNESAQAIFNALIKSLEENKTRVTKLLERLSHEKSLLDKRQAALNDSSSRANRITVLSQEAAQIRGNECRGLKETKAKLHVSLQKMRNIVAQIEEILQERFGALKTFFIERRMRFDH